MERVLFIMKILPGQEAEYERRHLAVWPALLADLYRAGFRNYSLFRRGREVFGYAECEPSAEAAFGQMNGSAANAEWAAWFGDVLEVAPSDGLVTADEVWHMDEELASTSSPQDTSRPGRESSNEGGNLS